MAVVNANNTKVEPNVETTTNVTQQKVDKTMIWDAKSTMIWEPTSVMLWEPQSTMLWKPQSTMIGEAVSVTNQSLPPIQNTNVSQQPKPKQEPKFRRDDLDIDPWAVSQTLNEDSVSLLADRTRSLLEMWAREWETIDKAALNAALSNQMKEMGIQFDPADKNQVSMIRNALNQVSGWMDFQEFSNWLNETVETANRLSIMPNSEIISWIQSWDITQSDILTLKKQNREKFNQIVELNNQKRETNLTNAEISWDKDTLTQSQTEKKVPDPNILAERDQDWLIYDGFVDTDEISNLEKELSPIDNEIISLLDQRENLKWDIEKQFKTSLDSSTLNALYNERIEDIDRSLNTLTRQRESIQWQINNKIERWEIAYKRKIEEQDRQLNMLTSWNWEALLNTTMDELVSMEQSWMIPNWYAQMLWNYQEWMIYNTLSQFWVVWSDDLNNIRGMIRMWVDPNTIIWWLMETSKFSPKQDTSLLTQTVKSWDYSYQFNPETWRYDVRIWSETYGTNKWEPNMSMPWVWFDLYNQPFWDYVWNHWADYKAVNWTPIPAPSDAILESIQTWKNIGIRATLKFSDGRRMYVDHLDPKTLESFWIDKNFSWKKEINQLVSAGQPIWFVGNTWTVATVIDWEMVYIRRDWVLEREDLQHLWNHSSVTIVDKDWRELSPAESDKELKAMVERSTTLNWQESPFLPSYMDYIEKWQEPAKYILESMGMDFQEFARKSKENYAYAKQEEYAEKWFEVTNPNAIARMTTKNMNDLTTSIDKMRWLESAFDEYISLLEEYGTEFTWVWDELLNWARSDIVLLAKEIYNLWVLNWPDLEIMESVLWVNPTTFRSIFRNNQRFITTANRARDRMRSQVTEKAKNNWLLYNPEVMTIREQQQNEQSILQNMLQTEQQNAQYRDEFSTMLNWMWYWTILPQTTN